VFLVFINQTLLFRPNEFLKQVQQKTCKRLFSSKHIKDALKAEGMYGAVISIPVNVTNSPELFIKQPPWSYW
jgi:hypothetical protein